MLDVGATIAPYIYATRGTGCHPVILAGGDESRLDDQFRSDVRTRSQGGVRGDA